MSATTDSLRLQAINRHRQRLFGDESLKAYTVTPEDGETVAATLLSDWFGQRVEKTTSGAAAESGAWQFQIWAEDDWATSQAFMLGLAALTIGTRRWKTKKVEKPIGNSKVWKVHAQIQ